MREKSVIVKEIRQYIASLDKSRSPRDREILEHKNAPQNVKLLVKRNNSPHQ